MNKKELRQHYLKKRQNLTTSDNDAIRFRIQQQLFRNFTLSKNQKVHIFLPIQKFNEINTWPIIERLWNRNVKTATSIPDLQTGELSHSTFDSQTKFVVNSWGIPQPYPVKPVSIKSLSLILVPLVIFDLEGYRIGYGKGFYDRFLVKCKPETIKVGLSTFEAIESIPNVDQHDIPLDYCITPTKVHHFNV